MEEGFGGICGYLLKSSGQLYGVFRSLKCGIFLSLRTAKLFDAAGEQFQAMWMDLLGQAGT